MLQQYLTFF